MKAGGRIHKNIWKMERQKDRKKLRTPCTEKVYSFLSAHENGVIPSDISKMGISSARIAAALNSLEKKASSRRIDTDDRRRILVNLTKMRTYGSGEA